MDFVVRTMASSYFGRLEFLARTKVNAKHVTRSQKKTAAATISNNES